MCAVIPVVEGVRLWWCERASAIVLLGMSDTSLPNGNWYAFWFFFKRASGFELSSLIWLHSKRKRLETTFLTQIAEPWNPLKASSCPFATHTERFASTLKLARQLTPQNWSSAGRVSDRESYKLHCHGASTIQLISAPPHIFKTFLRKSDKKPNHDRWRCFVNTTPGTSLSRVHFSRLFWHEGVRLSVGEVVNNCWNIPKLTRSFDDDEHHKFMESLWREISCHRFAVIHKWCSSFTSLWLVPVKSR